MEIGENMDNIGEKIKKLRLSNKMTLKDVSMKTNLSIGFLSQVERDKSSITLQAISKISDALEVSRSYFFEDSAEKEKSSVIQENESKLKYNFHSPDFVYQSLSGVINDAVFEPMLVVLLPSEEVTTTSSHRGQEFVYVLEGELTVIIGKEKTILQQGGSFHINSETPHTWFNQSEGSVKLIYVYSDK